MRQALAGRKCNPRFESATADLIRSVDAISVREQSGVGNCQEAE